MTEVSSAFTSPGTGTGDARVLHCEVVAGRVHAEHTGDSAATAPLGVRSR